MSKYFSSSLRTARCHLLPGEIKTQPGLAVTPSEMLEMAEAGIPINSINAESFYDDGRRSLDVEPPIDRRRGVDIGDLWENDMEIRKKMRKLYKMKGVEDGPVGKATPGAAE